MYFRYLQLITLIDPFYLINNKHVLFSVTNLIFGQTQQKAGNDLISNKIKLLIKQKM